MSRSFKANGQNRNTEYWGRRKCKLLYKDAGPSTKKLTHRAERNEAKVKARLAQESEEKG